MATVAKGLALLSSQKKSLSSFCVKTAAVKKVAGNAGQLPFYIEGHIKGDRHRRNNVNRMSKTSSLMAGEAYCGNSFIKEMRPACIKRKLYMAIKAFYTTFNIMDGIEHDGRRPCRQEYK